MTKLVYSWDELLAEHDYARPQLEAGYRLHGGFDENEKYISPRSLNRWPAIRAWSEAVKSRGHDLVDSSPRILVYGNFPSPAQQKFLLDQGLGRTLWDMMTTVAWTEARGRGLALSTPPDFQPVIVEDTSDTATGHLHKGLVYTHALDEGGDATRGEGGHDSMWFAVRDLLFGKDAYPAAEERASLGKHQAGRLMPQIPEQYEYWIMFVMNMLMIEIKAETFFDFCIAVARDKGNFTDRREAADRAAEIVERIRQDETPHVDYLAVALSEMRNFTFRTAEGGRILGAEMIDPIWRGMTQWHTVTNWHISRERLRKDLIEGLLHRTDGDDLVRRFEELEQKRAA